MATGTALVPTTEKVKQLGTLQLGYDDLTAAGKLKTLESITETDFKSKIRKLIDESWLVIFENNDKTRVIKDSSLFTPVVTP